jgi:hypothetical protein
MAYIAVHVAAFKSGQKRVPLADFPHQLDARDILLYGYNAITPAMAMRVTGIGSQYLLRSPKSRLVTLFEVSPDANELKFAADGSLTIHMSNGPPTDADARAKLSARTGRTVCADRARLRADAADPRQ